MHKPSDRKIVEPDRMNEHAAQILLPVGRLSDAKPLLVDLRDCPHLFIAYSKPAQAEQLFQLWLRNLHSKLPEIQFAFSVKRSIAGVFTNSSLNVFKQFIRYADGEQLSDSSADTFAADLIKEFKRRNREIKTGRNTLANLTPLLVMIDEIFEVILTRKKQTGLSMMQLLANGQEAGIHCIVASSGTYRNLLTQLQIIHPSIKQQLEKAGVITGGYSQQRLGAELVVTEDGLHFYRTKDEMIHQRLFPYQSA